jgi:hypothetical protein
VPDNSFEFRLERMFAEAPTAPDAELFTIKVVDRLDRGWTARRLLISVMGAAGGLIVGFQLLGAGGLGAVAEFGAQSRTYLAAHVTEPLAGVLPGGMVLDTQVILTAAVLALIAAGFGVARLMREI